MAADPAVVASVEAASAVASVEAASGVAADAKKLLEDIKKSGRWFPFAAFLFLYDISFITS